MASQQSMHHRWRICSEVVCDDGVGGAMSVGANFSLATYADGRPARPRQFCHGFCSIHGTAGISDNRPLAYAAPAKKFGQFLLTYSGPKGVSCSHPNNIHYCIEIQW